MVIARVKQATALNFDAPLKAALALEDGTILLGNGFGAPVKVTGEVVFNTGMVGYVESLTDPSYYGQILVQTYPLIGNYGVPKHGTESLTQMESDRIQVRGYAISDLCKTPSHRSSTETLDEWLSGQRKPGIFGIDTRELTKKLRIRGTMLGVLEVSNDAVDLKRLSQEVARITDPNREDLVKQVSVQHPVTYGDSQGPRIVLIDCGVKNGIIRSLTSRGCYVIRLPYDSSEDDMLQWHPAGIVVTNGPGDPKVCEATTSVLHTLIESHIPILGICLGLQLLALAEGADTYKMKFGHRGQNHPCLNLHSGRAWITSQNHGYAVDAESLKNTQFTVSLTHINDGTIEGIIHKNHPVRAVQFHPEASPGPTEAGIVFDEFLGDVKRYHG